jgi:hypothetical protein
MQKRSRNITGFEIDASFVPADLRMWQYSVYLEGGCENFPDALDTLSQGRAFRHNLSEHRLAAASKPKSVTRVATLAWFKNRISAESRLNFFRWPLGDRARKTSGGGGLERRRAHRVELNAPVFLYGSLKGEPFSEYAETINVCMHGALVAINARLFPEQRILLTNLQTYQDLKCRVVRLDKRKNATALEFLEFSPQFWCIEFASAFTRA